MTGLGILRSSVVAVDCVKWGGRVECGGGWWVWVARVCMQRFIMVWPRLSRGVFYGEGGGLWGDLL